MTATETWLVVAIVAAALATLCHLATIGGSTTTATLLDRLARALAAAAIGLLALALLVAP